MGSVPKIKHIRVENAIIGNLENAVYAITAHFVLLRLLMGFLTERMSREYVQKEYWSDYLVICV